MSGTRHACVCRTALWGAAVVVAGCSTRLPADPRPDGAAAAARPARAHVVFARAVLYKPPADGAPEALVFAPILVEETSEADDASSSTDRVVYVGEMNAQLHGVHYRQWVYIWSYPRERRWCWLRVTPDSLGFPVLWETVTDAGPPVEIYAARALENQALGQFGPAADLAAPVLAPGRASRAGQLVGILSDGPVAMGPMVYVDRQRRLPTVICRCMPAQVLDVGVTATYELAPTGTQPGLPWDPTEDSAFLAQDFLNAWPGGNTPADPRFLERNLRLPTGF